jgi:tripartite-type tricarboxylate transporter receptor subunit TctC
MLVTLSSAMAYSETYPTKPIRMIVPFAAGGPSDVVIRIVGQRLTEAWGQTVVIDNRGGAGGNIGVGLAAKSAPDGYTLLLASMHFVVNPSLYRSAGYDAEKDFAAVTNIAISPVILAAHPSLAARDPRELAQLAKRNTLDYGSPGTGTAGHLAGELFNLVAGIKMQHIPYKGAAPAFADLLGAQIKLAITAMPIATPHVKAGRLRAIAVTTLQRSPALPDAPTMAESGYPGFFVDNMYGVLAPRGTPAAIIASLHEAIVRVVKQPEFRERLITQGYDPLGNSPAEFAGYLRAEVGKWAKVVKESGLRAD